jgi:hypothetical protein
VNEELLEKLSELVYRVADTAESLDSDKAREITSDTELTALWSDLDYLKGYLDQAIALTRSMMNR